MTLQVSTLHTCYRIIILALKPFNQRDLNHKVVGFEELQKKREEHQLGGGKERQEEQRKKKKLTAFERMNLLFDSDSPVELDQFILHECTDFGMKKKRILSIILT